MSDHVLLWRATATISDLRNENERLRGALQELRLRLHAGGRRPEECYEMTVIDNALKGRATSRDSRGASHDFTADNLPE